MLDTISWNKDGLVPVIAQEYQTGEILMMAWMNKEALQLTVDTGKVVYYSRSRQKLWHKGEESGNTQKLMGLRIDCDADVILAEVEQLGGVACHTGRKSCFYRQLQDGDWCITDPVLKDPQQMYGKTDG